MQNFVFSFDAFFFQKCLHIFNHKLNLFLLFKFIHEDVENYTHDTDKHNQQKCAA